MNDCLFCKIVSGEITDYRVYEDDYTLAFLDINPNNAGHTLVIPKNHFENIYSISDEELVRLMLSVKKVAIAVKNAVNADGINIAMNNESAAGQDVFHAHIHVIPRQNDDGFKHFPHKKYKEGEAEEMAEKIKNILA